MRKWISCLLLASLGCTGTPKPTETVRPARPDEPKDSKPVPTAISRLLPEQIDESNAKLVAEQLGKDMAREMKEAERLQRPTASIEVKK